MAQRTMKPATTADVRDWARQNDWKDENERPVADRGRMPSSLVTAFNKANKKHRVEYVNGGRVVGDQSGTANTPAPRQESEKATSTPKAATARRASNTTQPSQAPQEAMVGQGSPEGVQAMIGALLAAQQGGRKGGTPILFSASTLVNV